MKNIKIDNEVYPYLPKKVIAFEENPNAVLHLNFNLNLVYTPQGYIVGETKK